MLKPVPPACVQSNNHWQLSQHGRCNEAVCYLPFPEAYSSHRLIAGCIKRSHHLQKVQASDSMDTAGHLVHRPAPWLALLSIW